MALEEKVIQTDSVNPPDQPVAETPSQPQAPNLDAIKAEYEAQVAAARKEAAEAQEKFKGIKGKLDDVYKQKDQQHKQELEDQGQWKTLWEEANKTAQEKEQQIVNLSQQLEDLKTSRSALVMVFKLAVRIPCSGAGHTVPGSLPILSDKPGSTSSHLQVPSG